MKLYRFYLIFLFTVLFKFLNAQERIVEGVSPHLYLLHPVAAKETWYSLSRSYNISPQELAAFNKLSIDKPLEIAQQIKIPLTAANFFQKDVKLSGSAFEPVYHVVQQKEWLYRIGQNHNKVSVETLEKWNSITADQARPGMKLIVGYLKTNGAVANKPATPVSQPTPEITQSVSSTSSTPSVSQAAKGGSGYFRPKYGGIGKTATGLSGVFKSTSGWNDGKYYALINSVAVGTIVRIDLPQSGKTIYAKVLGELPDMKESAGLALRISDAAANELGAPAGRFSVQISY